MRALITGVAGQDGTLLSAALVKKGWEVFGTHLHNEVISSEHALLGGNLTVLDVKDSEQVSAVIQDVNPDVIFHLAGITSVSASIENPELTLAVNVGGTQNLISALFPLIKYYKYSSLEHNFDLNHNDPLYPTIDHKTSIYFGFINKIDPINIGSIENLCITKRSFNSKKRDLCEDEFLKILKS